MKPKQKKTQQRPYFSRYLNTWIQPYLKSQLPNFFTSVSHFIYLQLVSVSCNLILTNQL